MLHIGFGDTNVWAIAKYKNIAATENINNFEPGCLYQRLDYPNGLTVDYNEGNVFGVIKLNPYPSGQSDKYIWDTFANIFYYIVTDEKAGKGHSKDSGGIDRSYLDGAYKPGKDYILIAHSGSNSFGSITIWNAFDGSINKPYAVDVTKSKQTFHYSTVNTSGVNTPITLRKEEFGLETVFTNIVSQVTPLEGGYFWKDRIANNGTISQSKEPNKGSHTSGYSNTSDYILIQHGSNTTITYTVDATVSPSGSGTVSAKKRYNGSEETVTLPLKLDTKFAWSVGGTEGNNLIIDNGDAGKESVAYVLIPNSKSGYTFDEWVYSSKSITSNTTFTANFSSTVIPCRISVSASPSTWGKVSGGGDYNVGDLCTLTATPNTGYIVDRWEDKYGYVTGSVSKLEFTVVESNNYTVYFKSKPSESYKVVFEKNTSGNVTGLPYEGKVTNVGTSTYTIPDNIPITIGYNFIGWKKNGTGDLLKPGDSVSLSSTATTRFLAQWELPKYKVTVGVSAKHNPTLIGIDKFGGISTTSSTEFEVEYNTSWYKNGDTLTIGNYKFKAVSNSGCSFIGWDLSTASGNITKDTDIHAIFDGNLVYIDFAWNGSKIRKDYEDLAKDRFVKVYDLYQYSYTKGLEDPVEIRLPNSSHVYKDYNRFVGWEAGSPDNIVDSTSAVKITTGHKLNAKWELIDYKVKFNSNGGVGSFEDIVLDNSKKPPQATIPEDYVPTLENYIFNGWNTKDDGSGDNYNAGSPIEYKDYLFPDGISEITLFATWVLDKPLKAKVGDKIKGITNGWVYINEDWKPVYEYNEEEGKVNYSYISVNVNNEWKELIDK